MNYIQAISSFFQTGRLPSEQEFSPELVEALKKDYQSLTNEGLKLRIDPQPDVQEDIKQLDDGSRVFRYTGVFVHGFERDGQLCPSPDEKPFANSKDAAERGEMVFQVDPSGKVIGWFDSLTGNVLGQSVEGRKPSTETNNFYLYFLIALMILFILWKFFGGLLF